MPLLMAAIFYADLPATARQIATRFCVIQGNDDFITPTQLVKMYFDQVQAPIKHMETVPNAGHFALMTHTGEFIEALARCRAASVRG
jgi:pimeloyl-ACP methyl ester carboxylesterase